MDVNVPYMPSNKNLHKILDAAQHAAVPESFSYEFLRDLGFTSSNDRSIIKVLKYLGMLDASGRPQKSYRDFVDHTKTKSVLAQRLKSAYDDLYVSHKKAHEKSVEDLKGWFRSKTGKGDAVAYKMAATFKVLTSYADFTNEPKETAAPPDKEPKGSSGPAAPPPDGNLGNGGGGLSGGFGLVYRLEIHLPDTQNIETYRAIFKAMKEELG
jgi:hypothetical protein